MINRIFKVFKSTNTPLTKVIVLELLHGLFLAAPIGFLLLIVWEFFKPVPDEGFVWTITLIMAICLILQFWVASKSMVLTNESVFTMTRKLRIMLGNKLQQLSLGYYKKRDPGDLASVVLQDVNNFESILGHTIGNIFGAIFATIFTSVFLFFLDWKLSLLMLSVIPLTVLFVFIGTQLVARIGEAQVAARNATGARFVEYIQGIRHLKAYNQLGREFKSMEAAFRTLKKMSIKTEAIPGPFIMTGIIFFELTFLLMVYFGIERLEINALTVSTFIAFLIIGYRLYEPLKIVMIDYATLRYMNISLKRIVDLMNAPAQGAGLNKHPTKYGIKFESVHFAYADRKVMDGIDLHLPQDKITALVGASGSGKSTIANLIARFWDVDHGKVSIGGIDVKNMSVDTIYSLISEVFQDVYLFDDTIYNNIKIGNPTATKAEILNMAEKAQLNAFIHDLPEGIHTKVGEGGCRLSGGQKQRISIARAMLKNAPIILLDEATASLDPENEIFIQQAIQSLIQDKTVVIIAHKLQTVKNADQIIVLKGGKVVESGTHDSLMTHSGIYANNWQIQASTRGWKLKK